MPDTDTNQVRYYEGRSNIEEEKVGHKKAFYDLVHAKLATIHSSTTILTKDKHEKISYICRKAKECNTAQFNYLSKQPGFHQAYHWRRMYRTVEVVSDNPEGARGTNHILVYRQNNESAALDTCKQVSHIERFYDDIYSAHRDDHPKARTLAGRVAAKYGRGIPGWVQRAFTDTCPRCIERMKRRKVTVGHQPILTKGFGVQGQVDLVDYQSMPDGSFKFLMNYIDHGIKLLWSTPLTHKRAITVAWALVQIFTFIGPPCILQSDNGREFSSAAQDGKGSRLELDNSFLDEIIKEIKNLWPECKMVRGSPRHSQSNGGVERINLSTEKKLGAWMKDNSSTRWAVG